MNRAQSKPGAAALHVADAGDLLAERQRSAWWLGLPIDTTPVEWALAHAARRYPVFPLTNLTKIPTAGSKGLYDATVDSARIRNMWPDRDGGWGRNIGLRCGVVFDVLDVDAHHGGLDTLSELASGDEAIIPCGPVVRTPNGGAHFYYQPTGYGSHTAIAPGIDFKADGGYVVGVGSAVGEGLYTWHEQDGETFDFDRPLVPLPKRFRDLIERAEAPNAPNDRPLDRPTIPANTQPGTKGQAYVIAALEREELNVARAPISERNDTLYSAAYSLARLEELDTQTITDVLVHAAGAAGLPEREAVATIGSAFKKRRR